MGIPEIVETVLQEHGMLHYLDEVLGACSGGRPPANRDAREAYDIVMRSPEWRRTLVNQATRPRKNPGATVQTCSPAKLRNLIEALENVGVAKIKPQEDPYSSEVFDIHKVLHPVLSEALGRNVGQSADWIAPAWSLGGSRHLVEEEGRDGHYTIDGKGTVLSPKALLAWAKREYTKESTTRRNPSGAQPLMVVKGTQPGVTFNVRLLKAGDPVGGPNWGMRGAPRGDQTTHKGEPSIEFYDARYATAESPLGQFVTRYRASTLADAGPGVDQSRQGVLHLQGGIPEWTVSAAGARKVRHYAAQLVGAPAAQVERLSKPAPRTRYGWPVEAKSRARKNPEEDEYRGWTIERLQMTQVGYPTKGGAFGKGRKSQEVLCTRKEDGTRKVVSTLKAAREYINTYEGPDTRKNPTASSTPRAHRTSTSFDSYEFLVSDSFLSALMNGDTSGLDDADIRKLEAFEKRAFKGPSGAVVGQGGQGHWTVLDHDAGFGRDEITGLLANRAKVAYMVPKRGRNV
jgi:hypothetical protein